MTIFKLLYKRCNAVKFEGNVCEEAKVTQLEDIEVGPAEKSFLIRSEDAKYVFIVLRLFLH